MGGKMDQIKGRIKEAAGVITDNDHLKRKGKLDQVVGKVKETAEQGAAFGAYCSGRPSFSSQASGPSWCSAHW